MLDVSIKIRKESIMKIKPFYLLLLALVTGCICLQESGEEHDETSAFSQSFNSYPRITAILTHKPNNGFDIKEKLGIERTIILYDESKDKSHKAKRSPAQTKTVK